MLSKKEVFWETDVCTFSCFRRCRLPKRLLGAQTKTKWSTYDGSLIFPSWFHTFVYTWTLKDYLKFIKNVLPVRCNWWLYLIFVSSLIENHFPPWDTTDVQSSCCSIFGLHIGHSSQMEKTWIYKGNEDVTWVLHV